MERIHSRIIPQGPLTHQTSAFAHLKLGFHETESAEPIFTSAWLWRSPWMLKDSRLRVAVTFPDEWQALQQSQIDSAAWDRLAFDIWIFKDLSLEENILLKKITAAPHNRVIIVASHLSEWKAFLHDPWISSLSISRQAYVHFMPKKFQHDPFLSPQEVLWELKELSPTTPIFTCDYSSNTNESEKFYETLDPKDHVALRKPTHTIQALRFLDKSGLMNWILTLESFLGFLLEGSYRRLSQTFQIFFRQYPVLNALKNQFVRLYWAIYPAFGLRHKIYPAMLFLLYPLRKMYWIFAYEMQKLKNKNV